jgi:hypothetical protein
MTEGPGAEPDTLTRAQTPPAAPGTGYLAGLLPGLLAGASLAAHWGGGLYWLVPASLLGIGGAVYSAWILLVEILR